MASHEINTRSSIIDVAPSQSGCLVAVLRSGELDVFEWDPSAITNSRHALRASVTVARDSSFSQLMQVTLLGETDIFVLMSEPTGTSIERFILHQDELHPHGCVYKSRQNILRIFPRSDHALLCFEADSGEVQGFHLEDPQLVSDICRFPESMAVVESARWHQSVSLPFFDALRTRNRVEADSGRRPF